MMRSNLVCFAVLLSGCASYDWIEPHPESLIRQYPSAHWRDIVIRSHSQHLPFEVFHDK